MACHLIKRPKLDNYLQRLLIFALFTQPAFALAFSEEKGNILFTLPFSDEDGNVLFTLACGAIVGAWVIGEAEWRRHVLGAFAVLSSFFSQDFIDFGLAGVMLPTAIACALRGDRFAWPWLVVLTVQLNVSFSDIFELRDGIPSFTPITQDDIIPSLCALILPVGIVAICRQFQGRRFLFRYALYLFYPAHLYVLGFSRLLTQAIPTS
jgi:TraX protein